MPKYSLLSGTRYIVQAPNEEVANEKLVAYWNGLDCPCGLPQWGEQEAERLENGGEIVEDWLCSCVQEIEADTDIRLEHVDGHPDA